MAKVNYQIDNWIFIPHENKLILDGLETLIDNRLSNLLLYLCQNPMTTLSRDELIDEVWKGLVLTDQVITQAIFELRKILKTNHKHLQGYIITVPKRGYKLDIDVQVLPSTNKTDTHTEKESLADGHITHVAGIRQEANPDDKKHIDSISNETAVDKQNIQLNQASGSSNAKTESLSKQTQNDEKQSARKTTRLKGPVVITALIFCLILLVFISQYSLKYIDPVSQDSSPEGQDKANQASSGVIYNNLEPRFIRARISTDLSSTQVQHGVIFKIVEYLKYKVNFRIAFHNTPHNDAAKELTFIITEENRRC
ncbi:DNA-binding protein with winged-HTH domain [Shewanella psychrophila]|uniref:DNA-binding protein with winged-HTH domain n=1 Tax=Shewanella psychrophila TaxID=225848 RepID=A0A1S6HP80_9GAMM|nr:winged helix-turn-helix domain-containing protein [Shewanella psychrophila]AQS37336.1 DNA-binding protein with winged-HTH domain [Shewanella psychrophila]